VSPAFHSSRPGVRLGRRYSGGSYPHSPPVVKRALGAVQELRRTAALCAVHPGARGSQSAQRYRLIRTERDQRTRSERAVKRGVREHGTARLRARHVAPVRARDDPTLGAFFCAILTGFRLKRRI
jgi:hypothetical protein